MLVLGDVTSYWNRFCLSFRWANRPVGNTANGGYIYWYKLKSKLSFMHTLHFFMFALTFYLPILRGWTSLPWTPWQIQTFVSMTRSCWSQLKWETRTRTSFSVCSPSVTPLWVRRRVKVGRGESPPGQHLDILFLQFSHPSVQGSWFIKLSLQMRVLWWRQLGTSALCFALEHLVPSPPQRWVRRSPTHCWPYWTSTTYARGCQW